MTGAVEPRLSHGYGYRLGPRTDDPRPLVTVDVDGVIAVDPPACVPATAHEVSAWGRWRREILVPDAAASVLERLAHHCEVAWVSAWSYTAHEALRDVLELPPTPWAFLPVQFDAVAVVREYAAGRPWAWIAEAGLATASQAGDGGVIAAVDPHGGLGLLDVDGLLAALGVVAG